jgi:hypothetical protein
MGAALRYGTADWLHHTAHYRRTFSETEDGDDHAILTYAFHDPLDADDLYRQSGVLGRARRS